MQLGTFHHRILKHLRAGGYLFREPNGIKLYDRMDKFITPIKDRFVEELKDQIIEVDVGKWTIKSGEQVIAPAERVTRPLVIEDVVNIDTAQMSPPVLISVAGIQIKITPVGETYAVDEIKIPGVVLDGAESLSDAIKLIGDHVEHHSINLISGLR